MCIAAAPLALISAGLSAGGAVMGGMQQQGQANYEAGVARNNRIMETRAAQSSEEIGRDESRDYWRGVSQTKGNQTAAMAANGIDLGMGSALRAQEDTVMQSREDAGNLYRNINERTTGHLINAQNYASEAKALKAKGKAAFRSGLLGGATSLLSGAMQYKGQRETLGKSGWF